MGPCTGVSDWISVLYIGVFEDGRSHRGCIRGGDISVPIISGGELL